MLDSFKQYADLGYSVIPLIEKKPRFGWKEFQTRRATLEEIQYWSRFNVGVVCGAISGDLFVIDVDDKERGRAFYRAHSSLVSTIVETPRGAHFYFRRPGARNTQGNKQDGRGEGGYVVAPTSVVFGKQYKFVEGHGLVPPEELREWRDDNVQTTSLRPRRVADAQAYISAITAVSGSGGHNATFRAACVLRDAGLSEAEALAALIEWNEHNAEPPWELKELVHKVTDAFKKG